MNSLFIAFSLFVIFLILDRINSIYTRRKDEKLEEKRSRLDVLKIITKQELKQASDPQSFKRWLQPFLEMTGHSNISINDLDGNSSFDLTCRKNDKIIFGLCKIWDTNQFDTPVERWEVEKLVGAMVGGRVKKGLVITASELTYEADQYINKLPAGYKITVLDGDSIFKSLEGLRKKLLEPLLQSH